MSELKSHLTIDIANFKGERGFHGLLCFYIHVRARFKKVCGPTVENTLILCQIVLRINWPVK